MQKTKIIATIGPASDNLSTIKKLILAGMDAARINLSHNTYDYHQQVINNVRAVAKKLNKPITIILDLQGPKIRIGAVADEGITIKKNGEIILVPENFKIPAETAHLYVPIQVPNIYKYIKAGQIIYVDDASIELKVIKIKKKGIQCKALNEGIIKSNKGLNFPGVEIKYPALSKKDLADIKFGLKNKVDYIALSYVSSADDVLKLRKYILKLQKKNGLKQIDFKKPAKAGKWSGINTRIIAKIENPQAVKNFNKILEATDAIMIARGDLGIEIPLEDLPLMQKGMISKCLQSSKSVIVATQMLNSMISKPYPTRAEVSDVANAILDGSDAIMLSGETATGKYPVRAVKIMDKIAREVEPAETEKIKQAISSTNLFSITDAIARDCKILAEQTNAKLIICTTTSGYTARAISSLKPKQSVIALTPSEITQRQLNLSWSIFPYFFKNMRSFDKFIVDIKKLVIKEKLAQVGDAIIICTSHPLGYIGQTNLTKIEIL